jgi:hypothetical protein
MPLRRFNYNRTNRLRRQHGCGVFGLPCGNIRGEVVSQYCRGNDRTGPVHDARNGFARRLFRCPGGTTSTRPKCGPARFRFLSSCLLRDVSFDPMPGAGDSACGDKSETGKGGLVFYVDSPSQGEKPEKAPPGARRMAAFQKYAGITPPLCPQSSTLWSPRNTRCRC